MDSDIPQFLGFAAPGGAWTLDYPKQVEAWCRVLAGETGCNLLVTIVDADAEKTRRQERGFHAMIAPWAKAKGHRVDDLKQILLAEVFGTHVFVDPRSGVELTVLSEPSTSRLTKQQYSDLIDRALDIAADMDDFHLIPPDEWRRARQKERQAALRAANKVRRG